MHGLAIYFNSKDKTKKQGEWVNGKRHLWLS